MKKVIMKKLLFSTMFILIVFFNALSQPFTYVQIVVDAGENDDGLEYYVISSEYSSGWIGTLYVLDEEYNIILAPLSTALSHDCSVQDAVFPQAPYIEYIDQELVNMEGVLSNGTRFTKLFYTIANYIGCGKDNVEIKGVTLGYEGSEVLACVHVFIPMRHTEKYNVLLELVPGSMVFEYRYLNSTHFELLIKLYYTKYGLADIVRIALKEYNITFRFLIDMNTWSASYWNGSNWIPVGTLPIATPSLDLSLLLYKLYEAYSKDVEYYLKHETELQITIKRLKSLIENNIDEARQFLFERANAALPQLWKEYHGVYLGKEISIKAREGMIVGPYVNITFPTYNQLTLLINSTALKNYKELIVEGLREYIEEGRLNKLNEVIAGNDGFISFNTTLRKGGVGSFLWAFVPSHLPLTPIGSMFILPATHLTEYLGEGPNYKIAYALLDIMPPETDITIEKTASPPEPPPQGNYITIAIDTRLAERFMLTTGDRVLHDRNTRLSILNNLESSVKTKYYNTWYEIVNGADPEKKFREFLEYLESAVLTTAYRLGGEKGVDIVRNLIYNNSSLPETTTTPPSGNEPGTSTTPSASDSNSSNSTSRGGEVSGWRSIYVTIPILVITPLILSTAYLLYRRRRSNRINAS